MAETLVFTLVLKSLWFTDSCSKRRTGSPILPALRLANQLAKPIRCNRSGLIVVVVHYQGRPFPVWPLNLEGTRR